MCYNKYRKREKLLKTRKGKDMYGIITKAGAILTKFQANTFEQAEAIMDCILVKNPQINTEFLLLCKMN